MRRRIKKKKGLLPDPAYEKLKERWVEELESEMDSLESWKRSLPCNIEEMNCKPDK